MYKTVEVDVEVEVNLSDFDSDELIEELESRGVNTAEYGDNRDLLTKIYEKRRLGEDYQQELDQLIWAGLGKVL